MRRLLITGSREWTNRNAMLEALKSAHAELKGDMNGPVILVTGGAKGADKMAEEIWDAYVGAEFIEQHLPKYDKYTQGQAPLKRNTYMVSLGADLCLAFPTRCKKTNCFKGDDRHLSHGTAYTIEKATLAGIDTRIVIG